MKGNKNELTRLLRSLEEIKDAKYIGSKEALELVKQDKKILQNPAEISDLINKRIGTSLIYAATPARVVGICKTFAWLCIELFFENDYFEKELYPLDYLKKKSQSRLENAVFMALGGYNVFEDSSHDISKALYPFFERANRLGIKNDHDIGDCFYEVIREAYDSLQEDCHNQETDTFLTSLGIKIENVNWAEELSQSRLAEREIEASRSRIYGAVRFMLDRLNRDDLLHKREYRLMVLMAYIEEHQEFITSYDTLINLLDEGIRIAKIAEGMDKTMDFQKVLGIAPPGLENQYITAYILRLIDMADAHLHPGSYENRLSLLQRAKLLRQFAGAEKDFFNRHLG